MSDKCIILFLLLVSLCNISFSQVTFEKSISEEKFILKAKNELPVDIRLIIKDSTNIKTYLLPSGNVPETVLELPLKNQPDTTAILDSFNFTVRIGSGEQLKIKRYRYTLPFKEGSRYKLIQGFNGAFSHDSEASRYALDFSMPVGDTVCAARGGMVVWTEDQFEEGGNDRNLINKANRILIMHDDGTIGFYVHLVKNGVLVKIGEKVEEGDPIGLSGNSGFSTMPHLHFAVHDDDQSIPIRFKQQPRKLVTGNYYVNQ
ncbi:M23 family metallopeptidase [Fulvivirga sedimenti]|uniref:M23 family metallopeptidase n=1 Tax=Fulvivirga sedimenti TaxID=2879465 RepID=A0A9X1HPN9_9BACT|nr:M23 family metallopeptidase [Fulvivirga sedimenti]MCA6074693.1 M23 family metallopeptidase [Fulvivirga sedimenti]MCA6075870.1 M23 family metallopeptidase [Fulvivirga sedimenti]MCA6076998.1 M23 family metallopeptidase [Fulvivirga sedimenti]